MKWLKAKPQTRIEYDLPKETPILHACCGGTNFFGDVRLDSDVTLNNLDIYGDVLQLPFKDDSFGCAVMDCPWTVGWKKNIADAMKELLRVAPVVYVLSPWVYGSKICKISDVYVAWQPGVNQTLSFIRYERNR
jgi:hypothetical protein